MSSKKKLVISLSVAAAVLVAAIIAIVAVFAAVSHDVTSNVNVTFRARNVDCMITASYKTNTTSETTFKDFHVLANETTSKTYEADVPNIDLYQESEGASVYLTVTYTIENLSSRPMTVTLEDLETNQYFEASYQNSRQ